MRVDRGEFDSRTEYNKILNLGYSFLVPKIVDMIPKNSICMFYRFGHSQSYFTNPFYRLTEIIYIPNDVL